ncbi:MAG: hypothetical protein PW788_15525 [Micavibrio sp.]|nr:hypothetical protein [Micavibrio sp.]
MTKRKSIAAACLTASLTLQTTVANALVCITPLTYDLQRFLDDLKIHLTVCAICMVIAALITATVYAFRRKKRISRRMLLATAVLAFFALQAALYYLAGAVQMSGNCGYEKPWVTELARPASWVICGLAAFVLYSLVKLARRKK